MSNTLDFHKYFTRTTPTLNKVERRVEEEERIKRKRNIIIKGVKLGSGTAEEAVKNLKKRKKILEKKKMLRGREERRKGLKMI